MTAAIRSELPINLAGAPAEAPRPAEGSRSTQNGQRPRHRRGSGTESIVGSIIDISVDAQLEIASSFARCTQCSPKNEQAVICCHIEIISSHISIQNINGAGARCIGADDKRCQRHILSLKHIHDDAGDADIIRSLGESGDRS